MSPAFDPLDFLSLAISLTSSPPNERELRTAVGRAYYAVFLLARNKMGIKTNAKSVHAQTQKALKRKNRGAGEMLEKLHRLRKVADYQMLPDDPSDRDWPKNWRDAESLAKYILPNIR